MARTENVWQTGIGGRYIETISPVGYDILINGSSKYLNFNTISGSSGYGLRDNSGVMEFKDSGGSWVKLSSTVGSKETPTGTINGSNTTFIGTQIYSHMNQDGATYFDGYGYTRSGFTYTMTVPPTGFIIGFY